MRDRRAETWTWWRATTAAISPRGRWSGASAPPPCGRVWPGWSTTPDDILPLVDLDAVETDGRGGLRTDLEALLAPIRTAKPYLFRTGEAEPPVLAGAVPAPPGGAPRRSYTMEELGRLTMEEYREARRIGAQGN